MKKLNLVLEWSATVLTVIGALFTAQNMYPENVIAFNAGSILWLWWAIRIKSKSLITVNFLMLVIFTFGVVKLLINQ